MHETYYTPLTARSMPTSWSAWRELKRLAISKRWPAMPARARGAMRDRRHPLLTSSAKSQLTQTGSSELISS